MKKYLIIYILVLSVSAIAGNNITSAFEFLRTDFSPRTAATSNAFLTIRGDVSAMTVNPAGMAYIDQKQFSFNYTNYLLDINGGSAAYAHLLPGLGVLSVGINYMDYGELEETDENAIPTGSLFSANDFALGVGLSNKLDEHFAYGINLKYAFSKIESYNASAIALDLGLMYEIPFQDNLFMALSLINVGQNFEYYGETKESLPMSLRLGISKRLAHLPLEIGASITDINVEADKTIDRLKRFSVGGEFRFSEKLRLRLGYNNDLRSNLETSTDDKFGGLAGGLSVHWKSYRFDYAYSNFSALGNIHRIGIFYTFNQ